MKNECHLIDRLIPQLLFTWLQNHHDIITRTKNNNVFLLESDIKYSTITGNHTGNKRI